MLEVRFLRLGKMVLTTWDTKTDSTMPLRTVKVRPSA
jgi:hypothetical protein